MPNPRENPVIPKKGEVVMTDHSLPDEPVHPAAFRPAPKRPANAAQPAFLSEAAASEAAPPSPPPPQQRRVVRAMPMPEVEEPPVIEADVRRATLLYPEDEAAEEASESEEGSAEASGDEPEADAAPSWAAAEADESPFSPEAVKKVSSMSEADVRKWALRMERKIGQQGAEKAAMDALIRQMYAQPGQQPSQPQQPQQAPEPQNLDFVNRRKELDREWDILSDKFLDDPSGSVRKQRELARKEAQLEFETKEYQSDLAYVAQQAHKHQLTENDYAMIDALAASQKGGSRRERYDKAIETYNAQFRNKPKAPAAPDAQSVAETEAMKERAALTPATASGGPRKPPPYSKSKFFSLPKDEQAKQYPKFLKAAAEGRLVP